MDERILDQYPKLDLSPLLGEGLYAVFCKNEYEAKCLLAAMKQQYPDKCKNWTLSNVAWYDTSGDGQLYFPDINNAEGEDFSWNGVDYDEIDKYTVVNCESLFDDGSDISESEMSIDFLVGGGV